jgi:hypothetical protein
VLTAINVILQQMAQKGCADRASVALMQVQANKEFQVWLAVNAAELAQSPEGTALLNTPLMRTDGIADDATISAFRELTGGAILSCGS